MTTPSFEYRPEGDIPELLEHYLRRFEELLSGAQQFSPETGSNLPAPGVEFSAAGSARELARDAAGTAGHGAFEQDIRQEIYSRFATGAENPLAAEGQTVPAGNPAVPRNAETDELLRALRTGLEDLTRALELNTEQLGDQDRSALELSD